MLLCERNEEIFIYCASVSKRCDSVEGGDVPVTIGRHSTTEHAQRPIGFADVLAEIKVHRFVGQPEFFEDDGDLPENKIGCQIIVQVH